MRILSRYFALRFLGLFFGISLASTLIIIMIEMLLNLDDMLRMHDGAPGVVQYLFLRIPSYYLRELIPISAFAASFFTLGFSAQSLEITAMKAGGISPQRAIAPVLVAAAFISLGSFMIGETWIANATLAWNRHEKGDGPKISYGQGSFWYRHGRTIYNISGTDPGTRTLRGVRLYELDRHGRLERSVYADRADVESDQRWLFHEATIREFDLEHADRGPAVRHIAELTLDVGSNVDAALADTDLHGLNVIELVDYIRVRKSHGEDVNSLSTALHTRLADPLAALLFALLAAPLGLQVGERRSFGVPALLGIIAIAAWFTLRNVGITLASEGVVGPSHAIWSGVSLFGVAGLIQLGRVRS